MWVFKDSPTVTASLSNHEKVVVGRSVDVSLDTDIMHELPHHKTVDSWQRDESTQLTQLTALETLRDVWRGATVLLHPGGTQTQAPGQGAVQVPWTDTLTSRDQHNSGWRWSEKLSAPVCPCLPSSPCWSSTWCPGQWPTPWGLSSGSTRPALLISTRQERFYMERNI